jgi:hypothetical protein
MSEQRSEKVLFSFKKEESGFEFEVKEVIVKPSDYHYTQKHYEITQFKDGEVFQKETLARAEELLDLISKLV